MAHLHELDSAGALQDFISANKNALICFSATWCGPCKQSKPALEEMAKDYATNVTMDVKFGIVYEHNLGDAIHSYNVSAFPTYMLFQQARVVGTIKGANLPGIRAMIDQAGCQADLTGGQSLGGGGEALSAAEARERRLAKLGGAAAASDSPASEKPPAEEQPVASKQPEEEETKDVEMTEAAAEGAKEPEAMEEDEKEKETVDPTAHLDKEAVQTLTESMGFSTLRAQKGLLYGNGGTVEGAIEWLMQHQDDVDIDEPIPPKEQKAQSYKCNDCGKILSNMANLELHANKTGHSDFQESTEAVKPLTAEEKAAKIAEIKALLKAKRTEREEAEKVDHVEREKQRRFMGQEMAKTREQLEQEQRKREAQKRKKEKQDEKRERERIRAELAKDKAERMANKGKLNSRLGVDGYNPSAIQYGEGEETNKPAESKKAKVSAAKIDEYIQKVSSYRAGGDGGKCLKILLLYVGNVVDNPEEPKYRSINMESKAFKNKVKPFVGGKSLLLALGFQPNESNDAMVLKEDADEQLLAGTKKKLADALEAYG